MNNTDTPWQLPVFELTLDERERLDIRWHGDRHLALARLFSAAGEASFPFWKELDRHALESFMGDLRSSKEHWHALNLSLPVRLADRETRWLRVALQPVSMSEGVTLWHGVAWDATRDREHHEKLAGELAGARSQISFVRDLFAGLNHEIRTPLQCLSGYLELLAASPLDESQKHLLEVARTQVTHILHIADNALDFSKLHASEMRLEKIPFSPASLLATATDVFSLQASMKGLSFKLETDPALPDTLLGDPTRLMQMLSNLLGNAIKFTASGGVTLRAKVHRPGGRGRSCTLCFEVEDSGAGLREAQIPALFEKYRQSDNHTARKHGGTGLGLSIVKNLAELMKGSVRAANRSDRAGAVFELIIPFDCLDPIADGHTSLDPASQPVSSERAAFAAEHPLSILIVDDSSMGLEMLRRMLVAHGYRPDCVVTGGEAVLAATSTHYDLILMDIHLPDMSGFAATEEIRARLQGGWGPWITGYSAHTNENFTERAADAGLDDFLPKPIKPDELRAVLKRCHRYKLQGIQASRNIFTQKHQIVDSEVVSMLRSLPWREGGTLFQRLKNIWLHETPDVIGKLHSALAAHDPTQLEEAAHRLKGNADAIGAERIRHCAFELMRRSRLKDLRPADTLVGTVELLVDEFEKEILKYS